MRTFILLKPDALANKVEQKIIDDLVGAGLVIERKQRVSVDLRVMQLFIEHYAEVINTLPPSFNFVGKLFNAFYYHGPHEIILMVVSYSGPEDVITYTRGLIGATSPAAAAEGTIRHKYSTDSYAIADGENRLLNNLIHASDSLVNAEKEIALWSVLMED
jgi:nucleoside-diphosphate kinase